MPKDQFESWVRKIESKCPKCAAKLNVRLTLDKYCTNCEYDEADLIDN